MLVAEQVEIDGKVASLVCRPEGASENSQGWSEQRERNPWDHAR